MSNRIHQLTQEAKSFLAEQNYNKALACFQEAADLAIRFGLIPVWAVNMNNAAFVYEAMSESDKAEAAYLEVLQLLSNRDPIYSNSLTALAHLYFRRADYTNARVYYRRTLDLQKGGLLKKRDPRYVETALFLAESSRRLGEYGEAENLYGRVLRLIPRELGPQHALHETTLNGMALLYQETGNLSKAETLFLQVLTMQEKRLGKDHPEYLQTEGCLVRVLAQTGQTAKAFPFIQHMLVNTLKNSDLETFLAALKPYFDLTNAEQRLVVARLLKEVGEKIGDAATRKLRVDKEGNAVEPLKDITRALSYLKKSAELGCQEAANHHDRLLGIISEFAASTIENIALDPSVVREIESAKEADFQGRHDEAIQNYEQLLRKVSDEYKITLTIRLTSSLKARAQRNLRSAVERLNTEKEQYQQQINFDVSSYFKKGVRRKANIEDGRCAKCSQPARYSVAMPDNRQFILCSKHYDELKPILNRPAPSTAFMGEMLYFVEQDLCRVQELQPDDKENRELLDTVRKTKPQYPAYRPYSPGKIIDEAVADSDPGAQRNAPQDIRRMEIVLEPLPDDQVGVQCNGKHSHSFDRLCLAEGMPMQPEDDPRTYGEKVYAALFPSGSDTHSALQMHPDLIMLVPLRADLQDIPWEYACGPEGFVVLAHQFVRGLRPERRIAPALQDTDLHVVAVPADPLELDKEHSPLNIEGEWLRLKESIQMVSGGIWLERTFPPTIHRLRELVANKKNRIVHFMGHGSRHGSDTLLCFENEHGGLDQVTPEAFVQRLKGTVFLVSLNACLTATAGATEFSNLAAKLVEEQVPYALGMRLEVPDQDSLILSNVLYGELVRGSSVEEAVRQVRQRLATDSKPAAFGIPILYTALSAPATGFVRASGVPRILEHYPPLEVNAVPQSEGIFRGRTKELQDIGKCLTGVTRPKVLTLHGVGGQGKTALARKAAERFCHAWPGGVWAISLESLPSFEAFIRHLARFLEIADAVTGDLTTITRLLLGRLNQQRTLIILDNAETLVEAVSRREMAALELAQFIRQQMLSTSVSVLATSRSHLGWAGETVLELDGLDPEAGGQLFLQCIPLEIGEDAQMIGRWRLFRSVVKELSRKVDGHPLGLFLLGKAYAESNSLKKSTIEDFIGQFDSLLHNVSDRYQPDTHRHYTIDACLQVSVDALSEDLRNLLGKLPIFSTHFLPELAAAVFGHQELANSYELAGVLMDIGEPRDPEDGVDVLTPIYNKTNTWFPYGDDESIYANLETLWQRGLLLREVLTTTSQEGIARVMLYRLPPTVRSYLDVHSVQDQALLPRFGEAYSVLAGEISSSPIKVMVAEACLPDLKKALEYTTGRIRVEYLLGLSALLERFGPRSESVKFAKEASRLSGEVIQVSKPVSRGRGHDDEYYSRITAMTAEAISLGNEGEIKKALKLFEDIINICQDRNDRFGEARTRNNIGQLYRISGQQEKALKNIQEARELFHNEKDRRGEAEALNGLGHVYLTSLGNLKQALKHFNLAYKAMNRKDSKVFEEVDQSLLGIILNNLGETNRQMGKAEEAMKFFEQALPILHELKHPDEPVTLYNMGRIAKTMGQQEKAGRYFDDALARSHEKGKSEVEAAVYIEQSVNESPDRAKKLLEDACRIYENTGNAGFEASARASLAVQLESMGYRDKAIEEMEKSVKLLKDNKLPQDSGGGTLKQHNDFLDRLRSGYI